MPRMTPAIIFYALDTAVTRQFYETFGLVFVEEKHGTGPTHYACDFIGMVFEIYPLRDGVTIKPCDTVAAAIPVDDFDGVVATLKAMEFKLGKVVVFIETEDRDLRAVSVRDPDGRLVRILEQDPNDIQ